MVHCVRDLDRSFMVIRDSPFWNTVMKYPAPALTLPRLSIEPGLVMKSLAMPYRRISPVLPDGYGFFAFRGNPLWGHVSYFMTHFLPLEIPVL